MKSSEPVNLTGRDDYIIIKALAFAIITIERLPERWQPWSDLQDMRKLLFALAGDYYAELCLTEAQGTIERRGIHLGPNGKIEVAPREEEGNVTPLR